MDEDGTVFDIHEIRPERGGRREAKQVIRRWAATYTFAWTDAMRLV